MPKNNTSIQLNARWDNAGKANNESSKFSEKFGEISPSKMKIKKSSRQGQHQACQIVYFQTKNTNLGKFLGSCNGRGWSI
jgi:hypothetical protein